jgi:hypothetical protein
MDIFRILRNHRSLSLAVISVLIGGAVVSSFTLIWGHEADASPHRATVATYSSSPGAVPASERIQGSSNMPGGVTTSPAPPSAEPVVSQLAAEQTSSSSPGGAIGKSVQPSVLYGLLTDTQYGTIGSDGTVTPSFINYPVWVVEYSGVHIPATGAPGASTSSSGAVGVQGGSTIVFIDASSGKYLYTLSF